MTKEDYQALNARCEKALKDIETYGVEIWLHKASKLIKLISIQPEGSPSIASSHFEGVHYPFISEFHRIYQQKLKVFNETPQP